MKANQSFLVHSWEMSAANQAAFLNSSQEINLRNRFSWKTLPEAQQTQELTP